MVKVRSGLVVKGYGHIGDLDHLETTAPTTSTASVSMLIPSLEFEHKLDMHRFNTEKALAQSELDEETFTRLPP